MQFGYDAASQLTTAADAYSNYTYVYDALGRVTSETWANPGAPVVQLLQKFDAASRRTELLARIDHGSGYRDDLKNTYQHDNLARMTRVDQAGVAGGNAVAEKRVDFAYNAASQFTEIKRYKDTDGLAGDLIANSAYTYDGIGRLTGLVHTRNSTTFANYTWAFDAASRVTSMNFTSLVGPSGTTTYSYDNTGQLTAADHSFQADENFTYDLNGNRTNTGYGTGTNNRLTSDGTFNYTYDAEGNRLTRTRISGAQADDYLTEYAWDHRNRLTSVTQKNNSGVATMSIAWEYDVFDRRVEATLDADGAGPAVAIVARWVHDHAGKIDPATGVPLDDLLLVFNGSGEIYHRYLHGPGIDQILADEQYATPSQTPSVPGETFWALADNLGSVRDVLKYDTGTQSVVVANHLVFDSFGKITSETAPSVEFAYGFTGRERDESTGYNYNRGRTYDVFTHTWLSEDPIGFAAGDTNLARYVGNGPTNATDPSGLYEVDVHFYMTYYLAAAVGLADIREFEFKNEKGERYSEAYVIAWAANYVDVHSETQPVQLGNKVVRYKYHFRHRDGSTTMAGAPPADEPIKLAFKLGDPVLMGIGCHAYEDSYSHHGYDSQHATNLWVDRPATDGIYFDMRMAEFTFIYLKAYYKARTGKESPTQWKDVEGIVLRMLTINDLIDGERDYDRETQRSVNAWKAVILRDFQRRADFGKLEDNDDHPWASRFLDSARLVDDPTDPNDDTSKNTASAPDLPPELFAPPRQIHK